MAGLTARVDRDRDRHLATLHRLLESQLHLGLEVAALLGLGPCAAAAEAAARRAAASTAEQVAQDVAEASEVAAERAGVEAAGATAATAEAAEDPAALVEL